MEHTAGAAHNISRIGSECDDVSQQSTSTAVVREDVTSGTSFNIDAELAVLFDELFADDLEAPRIPLPGPIFGMGGDGSEEDEIPELLTDDDMPELGPLSPWSSPATSFRDLDEESFFSEGQALSEEIIAELARLYPRPDTFIQPGRPAFPTPYQLRAISELIIVEYTRRGADGHEQPPDSDSDDEDWYSSDDEEEDMYSDRPSNTRDADTQGSLSQGRNQPNVPVPQSPLMTNDAAGSDINDANPPPAIPLQSFREEMWRTRRMFAHRSLLIKLELADLEDTYDAVDPPQYPNLSLIENALALSLTCTANEEEDRASVRATNEEYRPPQPNPEYKSISPPYSAPPDIPNPEVHQFFPLPPA